MQVKVKVKVMAWHGMAMTVRSQEHEANGNSVLVIAPSLAKMPSRPRGSGALYSALLSTPLGETFTRSNRLVLKTFFRCGGGK